MIDAQPPEVAPSRSTNGAAAAAAGAPAAHELRLIWSRALEGRDAEDYDAFVERAWSGHYAQARWWARIACAGRPYRSSFVLARDRHGRVAGAAHLLRAAQLGLPLPYAVVERGPVLEHPALLPSFLQHLGRALRRRGIVRLGIMPYWENGAGDALAGTLAELGWKNVQTAAGAHAATLRMPVAGRPDDALFAGGAFVQLRRKISAADRAGARARRGTAADLPIFAELHGALMRRQGRHGKSNAWLRAMGEQDFGPGGRMGLFVTEHEDRAVAAALMVRHGRLVTYALGASDQAPVRFSKMVPCFVAAIRWVRELGCDFDLGGVPIDGDSDPKRSSIAQFKRDFSQTRVDLVGQHARWLL